MQKLLKFNINRWHQLDPTGDALIRALQATVPGIIGVLCWFYFRKPFTLWITLMPVFTFFVINRVPTYKQKFLTLANFLFLMEIIQFAISVLYLHPYVKSH